MNRLIVSSFPFPVTLSNQSACSPRKRLTGNGQPETLSGVHSLGARDVAQFGSASFGTMRPPVQIRPSRPEPPAHRGLLSCCRRRDAVVDRSAQVTRRERFAHPGRRPRPSGEECIGIAVRRRITGGALCSLPAKASRTARVTAMPPIDPTWKSTITASGGLETTASATARGSLISVIVYRASPSAARTSVRIQGLIGNDKDGGHEGRVVEGLSPLGCNSQFAIRNGQ